MADLNAPQEDEICYISIEDVKDTLKGDFTTMTDEVIEAYIIEGQNQVNAYLFKINPDIGCGGIDCEDVCINIKRATVNVIKSIYEDENTEVVVDTLKAGDIVSEENSCGMKVEYYTGNNSVTGETPCSFIDCTIQDMLSCYEKRSGKLSICKSPCFNPCNTKCEG